MMIRGGFSISILGRMPSISRRGRRCGLREWGEGGIGWVGWCWCFGVIRRFSLLVISLDRMESAVYVCQLLYQCVRSTSARDFQGHRQYLNPNTFCHLGIENVFLSSSQSNIQERRQSVVAKNGLDSFSERRWIGWIGYWYVAGWCLVVVVLFAVRDGPLLQQFLFLLSWTF